MILYPPEVINEKFLIKLRDCVVKMPEQHPVKRWLKWVAQSRPLSTKEQEEKKFILEMVNSQFNLITDLKVKNRIISSLHKMPEGTIPEQLLKSYLYLLIGNITRSDNILKEITRTPPRVNWEKSGLRPSFYHKIGRSELKQIFYKLSHHPADRRTFELLNLYFRSYYNDQAFLSLVNDIDTNEVEEKLSLKFVEGLSQSLVQYLRVSRMTEMMKYQTLRDLTKIPLDTQAYWFWAFTEIGPLVSEAMLSELLRLEKEDQLWFIFLMEDEKLADLFSAKSGKSFLPSRRPYLKECLKDTHSFMMGLYKLIELGDINPELVVLTSLQLTNE